MRVPGHRAATANTTGHKRRGTVFLRPITAIKAGRPFTLPFPRPVPYPQSFSSPEPMCAGRRSPSTRRSPKHLPCGAVRRPTATSTSATHDQPRFVWPWRRGGMVRTLNAVLFFRRTPVRDNGGWCHGHSKRQHKDIASARPTARHHPHERGPSDQRPAKRGYARAVLQALARTQHGRPTAHVQRVLRESLTPLGVRSRPPDCINLRPTSPPDDPSN